MSWDKIQLGDIYKITSGGTPSRKKDEYYNGGIIPWIKTGDLKNTEIHAPSECITELGLQNSSTKLFPCDTILLALYGATIGACSILKIEAATNQACGALLPNPKIVNERFTYYYLKSIKSELIRKGVGGAQPNISGGILKSIQIPLPPLPEQKRIATILDEADHLRQKDKQVIEKYNLLSQSVFLEMFGDPVTNPKGWEERTLLDVCTKITDGTHHSPPLVKEGIPYITAKHIKEFEVVFESKPTYVDEKHHKEIYARCSPEYGDVLYIKDGATTGKAAVNKYSFPFSMLSSLALLKVDIEVITSQYLTHWLNNKIVKELLLRGMSGAAIKGFTLTKIKKFKINLPPIELQNQFANIIIQIEQQKSQAQKSLEKSEDLFQSLLQRAFKGEL